MNHQITLEELGMIPPTPEPPKKAVSTAAIPCFDCICNHCANCTVVTDAQEKWTSRVMCARTVSTMTGKVGICGGASAIGIKSRIRMQQK